MPSVPILGGELLLHLKQKSEYVSATKNYYGLTAPGNATSAAAWQIRQETLDSQGRTTDIQFANGSIDYNLIWDNRATYTYS